MQVVYMDNDIMRCYRAKNLQTPFSCKSVFYDFNEPIDFHILSDELFLPNDKNIWLISRVYLESAAMRYRPIPFFYHQTYHLTGNTVFEKRESDFYGSQCFSVLQIAPECKAALLSAMQQLPFRSFAIICDHTPPTENLMSLWERLCDLPFHLDSVCSVAASILAAGMGFVHFIHGNDGISVNRLSALN